MPDPTPATPAAKPATPPPAVKPAPAPAKPATPAQPAADTSSLTPIGVKIPETKPVADEIRDNNVLSVYRWTDAKGRVKWTARIGPEGRGLSATADQPHEAMADVIHECEWQGWIFDPSWMPKD